MNSKLILTHVATAAIGVAMSTTAIAQDNPTELRIFSHAVHQSVTSGADGDITAAWQEENGVDLNWVTLDTTQLHDQLFRELELQESSVDLAFVLNTRAVESVTTKLEPLDELMAANPIEDYDDIFPGMRSGMVFNGQTFGVPFRHASSCLHYNKRIFDERGIPEPQTIEDVIAAARQATHTVDGQDVAGFMIPSGYSNVVDLARAWDGDFIDMNYELQITEEPMRRVFTLLKEFYEEGVMLRSWASVTGPNEINAFIQNGRLAMTMSSCGRNILYNDPTQSPEAGNIVTIALPASIELQDQFDVAPAKIEFWTMVIPANSQNKELAWDLIQTLLTKENTILAALNGNGPVRASAYDDPRISEQLPYGEAEKAVLLVGRVPLPPFDESQRAADIFAENLQAAVLGFISVDEALEEIQAQVTPLLP